MNQSAIKRIDLLFQKHIVEHAMFYTIGLVLSAAALVFGLYIYHDDLSVWNPFTYYIGASVVGVFWLFFIFVPLRSEINLLGATLPATRGEKFAFFWLLCYVLAPLAFLAVASILLVINNMTSANGALCYTDFLGVFAENMLSILVLHSVIFALCMSSSMKPKNSWLWVVIVAFVILLTRQWTLGGVTFTNLLNPLRAEVLFADNESAVIHIHNLNLSAEMHSWITNGFNTITTLTFWIIGWFAFKEHETR